MAELAAELGAPSVTVLGHSFGGVVGAVLGSGWYGVTVDRVVALGVKIDWTDDEVARAQAMARRPPQVFAQRRRGRRPAPEAGGAARPRRPGRPRGPGRRAGRRRRLDRRARPAAFGAVGPSVETVAVPLRGPLRLAAGSADPMVGLDAMRRVDPDAVLIDGAGHNAH